MKLTEGKADITFEGYVYMAKLAVHANHDFSQATFAWCFLTKCWNLMARSNNTGKVMRPHIGWDRDAMTVCRLLLLAYT